MNDMQNTVRRIFDVDEEHPFIQIPTSADCRGYSDLLGEDPETQYQLEAGNSRITYHSLTCFSDHISFSLYDDINCNLIPKGDGYLLQIIDEDAEDSLVENHIHTGEDLINAISGFLSVSRKTKDGEQ